MKFLAASAATLQLSSWSLEDFEASEASLWWGRLKWNCRCVCCSWLKSERTKWQAASSTLSHLGESFPALALDGASWIPCFTHIFPHRTRQHYYYSSAWKTNNERAKLNHSLTTLGTMSLFPAEEMLPKAEKLKFPDTSNAEITDITKNAILKVSVLGSGLNGKVWKMAKVGKIFDIW